MKKFLILIAGFTALLSKASFAQQSTYLGIKGGLSIPSLSAGATKNDWNTDYMSRLGPHFGAFATVPITQHFSIVPEFNFSGQGGKRNSIQPMSIPEQYLTLFQNTFNTDKDYLFANLNNVSRINYLQIPVHLRYSRPIALKGNLSFHVQAGPYLGYMVSAKQIVGSESLSVYMDAAGEKQIPEALVAEFFGTSIDTIIDAKNDLYRWNFGVSGAVGLTYNFNKGQLILEGGGNYGFRYIQKGSDHGENRIGAGMVVLGYAYPICRKAVQTGRSKL
jgi:hypothetical protein